LWVYHYPSRWTNNAGVDKLRRRKHDWDSNIVMGQQFCQHHWT
jgi:hypothetical protein